MTFHSTKMLTCISRAFTLYVSSAIKKCNYPLKTSQKRFLMATMVGEDKNIKTKPFKCSTHFFHPPTWKYSLIFCSQIAPVCTTCNDLIEKEVFFIYFSDNNFNGVFVTFQEYIKKKQLISFFVIEREFKNFYGVFMD